MVLSVLVEYPCQGVLETVLMGPSVRSANVVGEREDHILEGVVVLDGHLDLICELGALRLSGILVDPLPRE